MLRILLGVIAMMLFAAAGLALLSVADHAAAQSPRCQNAIDDDGDTNVNDGCPIVGSFAEDPSCVDNIDAPDEDPNTAGNQDDDTVVNDGCPAKPGPGTTGREDQATQCADAVDNDADTRVNDGCDRAGSFDENPACADNIDAPDEDPNTAGNQDDDTVVNDGCPQKGDRPETDASVGGIAELPEVAGDSGWSTGTYAALAGGLAAAVLALGAGAWYARRRLS